MASRLLLVVQPGSEVAVSEAPADCCIRREAAASTSLLLVVRSRRAADPLMLEDEDEDEVVVGVDVLRPERKQLLGSPLR